jgi:asparagine synthase (glutamine-hydrolysing)
VTALGVFPTGERPSADAEQPQLQGPIRLDNRRELAATLGLTETASSDHALVLAAYRRWGDRCPERLEGDFAFALSDPKCDTLLLARDRFGVQPLYYRDSADGLAVATDAAGLLGRRGGERLNPRRVADYLLGFHDDKVSTVWAGILRLPPGHVLVRRGTRVRTSCYWTLDPERRLHLGSDAEYEAAFRHAFTAAVRARLPEHGRFGSMLSGGLDSSSITATAQQRRAEPVLALAAVFDDVRTSDEREYARTVAAHTGCRLIECPVDGHSPLGEWTGAPWRGAEPRWNPQLALVQAVMDGARAHGVEVVLSGLGGDTVVSYGYGRLSELLASGRLRTWARELQNLSMTGHGSLRSLALTRSLMPLVPNAARSAWRWARGREPIRPWVLDNPMRPDAMRRLGVLERARELVGDRAPTWRQRHATAHELTSGLLTVALETAARTGRAGGVEFVYPFLDRRLVELCLAMPSDQKLRDGWSRSILRRSMAGLLPAPVQWRRDKGDLSHAVRHGLRTADQQRIESVIAAPGPIAEYVDPSRLAELYRRCLAGDTNRDWFTLWRVVVIALWLEEQDR